MKIAINKIDYSFLFLLFLTVIFTSYLRISLLLIYPLLILLFSYLYKLKVTSTFLFLLSIQLLAWGISLNHGFYFNHNLVSWFYFIPFLFLLFSRPDKNFLPRNSFKTFLSLIVFFTVINDFVGLIQYFRSPGDDSFIGIYGRFTVTQNGLAILNSILSFYFFLVFLFFKRKKALLGVLFFFFCSILGFYGAGLLAFFIAMALFYTRISIKGIFKIAFLATVFIVIAYFVMSYISPNTLEYNITIVKKFWNASIGNAPRKVIVFYNYTKAYPPNFVDFLFGSGPGTFNSRSAFMVGSPTYFNLDFIKSDRQPYYFANYAYPLWNASNTGPYDGFMNQPFSSLLALLGEYGFLFTISFLFAFFRKLKENIVLHEKDNKEQAFLRGLYKFLLLFTFCLLIIDNYLEYPEIIGLLLIMAVLIKYEIQIHANSSTNILGPSKGV